MTGSSPPPTALLPAAEDSHATKGLLRLTMACNERCPFCNVPVEDYPRPTPPPEEVEAALEAFVATGQRTLTISGGEPTLLRRRLVDLVARARARGIPLVELQTNAVLVDPGYAAELAAAGLTSAFVSLLSHEPALHDQLAGLPGAFPRCLLGIDALLAAGVRVTLNPVFAAPTQGTVAAYVDFVAARLPGVDSVSLSAVQPHGRAAGQPGLLPDYAVLADSVRQARARAAAHGIRLLNPYCGLPLCVGWEDGQEASVEAQEAAAGGWQERPGLENTGDKRQGPPCRDCGLRTRCGGAWHAVWDQRAGAGIRAPVRAAPPWEASVSGTDLVWARPAGLSPAALPGLLTGPTTDLALDLPVAALDPLGAPDRGLLLALRRLDRENARRQPQGRLHAWLRLRGADPAAAERALQVAQALGVHRADLDGPVRAHQPRLRALFPDLFPPLSAAAGEVSPG
ncbi:radical SAM protein [Myxococcota bacterium]|nr:radical SAM protein [Myxococcota bacterium]